jgi:hypothetical protein
MHDLFSCGTEFLTTGRVTGRKNCNSIGHIKNLILPHTLFYTAESAENEYLGYFCRKLALREFRSTGTFFSMAKNNPFTQHPSTVGMTYLQHFVFASKLAVWTFASCVASVFHAFFPFLFKTFTSRTVYRLNDLLKDRLKKGDT